MNEPLVYTYWLLAISSLLQRSISSINSTFYNALLARFSRAIFFWPVFICRTFSALQIAPRRFLLTGQVFARIGRRAFPPAHCKKSSSLNNSKLRSVLYVFPIVAATISSYVDFTSCNSILIFVSNFKYIVS